VLSGLLPSSSADPGAARHRGSSPAAREQVAGRSPLMRSAGERTFFMKVPCRRCRTGPRRAPAPLRRSCRRQQARPRRQASSEFRHTVRPAVGPTVFLVRASGITPILPAPAPVLPCARVTPPCWATQCIGGGMGVASASNVGEQKPDRRCRDGHQRAATRFRSRKE
jgi:hypothetical protein